MKSLDELIDGVVSEYKQDPRNKVFVGEDILLASAAEETGGAVDAEALRAAISAYQSGDMSDEQQALYDGAVAACGRIARSCDLDYDIAWIENDGGLWSAEVRPS
jgi:hypothetical protein